MSVHQDRRAAKAVRIPFEAIVEIGGELLPGAAFEAQSVDLSVSGMHLRTAYLPEIGQALLCRFGSGAEDIAAEAEVVWRREESRGGEFGIRFTNLDGASAGALCQMCGIASAGSSEDVETSRQAQPGTRVRLHIDGLGSPMKARVRGATESELLVGSNLEFLRVGRPIELEDVDRGGKRPAHIDRVDIEIERESRVPQLVVTLRYDDVDAASGTRAGKGSKEAYAPNGAKSEANGSTDNASVDMAARPMALLRRRYQKARAQWTGSRATRAARRLVMRMAQLGERGKTTTKLLWGRIFDGHSGLTRRFARAAEGKPSVRRMTSPPPGGALHATGKRVVREVAAEDVADSSSAVKRLRFGKLALPAGIGASVLVLAVTLVVLLRRPHPQSTPIPAADAKTAASDPNPPAVGATTAPDPALANNAAPPVAPDSATNAHIEPVDDTKAAVPNATLQLVPKFGFGKVHQATIVQVQLDGPIPTIHGARLANGFTVSVPGRRTTDRAALLGRADPRLANVKVVNRAKGTELTFEFRDTVPAFMVRARGDHLEVSLGQSVPSRGPVAARTSNADHARTDERRHSTRSTNSR